MTTKRAPATTPTSSPFSGLAALRDQLPAGPSPEARPERAAQPARGPARAVVRLERKHRGGKEVTVIDKLGLSPDELSTWCRELKAALGCGGSVDGDVIVLQGDLRARLSDLLQRRGVGKVTIG